MPPNKRLSINLVQLTIAEYEANMYNICLTNAKIFYEIHICLLFLQLAKKRPKILFLTSWYIASMERRKKCDLCYMKCFNKL